MCVERGNGGGFLNGCWCPVQQQGVACCGNACLEALPLGCSLAQDGAVVMVVVLIAAPGLEQN